MSNDSNTNEHLLRQEMERGNPPLGDTIGGMEIVGEVGVGRGRQFDYSNFQFAGEFIVILFLSVQLESLITVADLLIVGHRRRPVTPRARMDMQRELQ
jgi:hypothetical protein